MTINPLRVVRDRCDQARRQAKLEVVDYLRTTAREEHHAPGSAHRRSALGQAANEIDRQARLP